MNKALKTAYLLILFILSTAFNSVAQQYYYTECDSFLIGDEFKISEQEEHEFKRSYSERTFVYCSPDLNSERLGFVNFNTTLTTLETVSHVRKDSFNMYSNRPTEYQYKYDITNWNKINFRKGVGYIQETDLAFEVNEEGPFLVNFTKINHDRSIELKAISSEPQSRGSLDKLKLPLLHGYQIKLCAFNGLAQSGTLIAYETYRESCPGTSITHLIILNKNGFTDLISTYSTGEAGLFDSESVYFPIKTESGEIKLIAESYLTNHYIENGKVNLKEIAGFPYPSIIGIPIERLVVKKRSYTEEITDENGEPLYDENENYRVNVIHEEPVFYEWDGTDLIELGSNYYLNRLDDLSKHTSDSTIVDRQKEATDKVNFPIFQTV